MKYTVFIAIAVLGQSFMTTLAHGATEPRELPDSTRHGQGQGCLEPEGGRNLDVDDTELLFDRDTSNSVPNHLIVARGLSARDFGHDNPPPPSRGELHSHFSNAAGSLDGSLRWFDAADQQNEQTIKCIEGAIAMMENRKSRKLSAAMDECLNSALNARKNMDVGIRLLNQAATFGNSAMEGIGLNPIPKPQPDAQQPENPPKPRSDARRQRKEPDPPRGRRPRRDDEGAPPDYREQDFRGGGYSSKKQGRDPRKDDRRGRGR